MEVTVERDASGLLHGALRATRGADGLTRPSRFTETQVRELAGLAAWHPRLYREMAACTSGICLDMVTDCAHLALEVVPDPFPSGTVAMLRDLLAHDPEARPPYDGFSLVADGKKLGVRVPGEDGFARFAAGAFPGKTRRVRIWLPCLTGCKLGRIQGDGSYIDPVPANKALLVLGDSISQGFTALDPALTWPALLADNLGFTLVNQGVGGQVFQPGSVADVAQAVDAAALVVEFGANYRFEPCRADSVERDADAFFREVSRAFPSTPTLVVTPLFHTEDVYPTHPQSCFADVARIIASAAAPHAQMHVVDGDGILPTNPAILADGSDHPGVVGQQIVCKKLRKSFSFAEINLQVDAP